MWARVRYQVWRCQPFGSGGCAGEYLYPSFPRRWYYIAYHVWNTWLFAAKIAAVDPKDATMMELGLQLVDDEPEVQSIMEQAFAAKEDESDFLKRIKNSPQKIVEGDGLAPKTIRNIHSCLSSALRHAKKKHLVSSYDNRLRTYILVMYLIDT